LPFWKESWLIWFLIYSYAGLFLVACDLPYWVTVFVVLAIWFEAQSSSVWMGRHVGATGVALLGAGSQLAFLFLFGAWPVGVQTCLTTANWVFSLPFFAASLSAVLALEQKQSSPIPRYGLEGLVITCFSAAYMLTRFKCTLTPMVPLMVVHLGILIIALVRNSRLAVGLEHGPIDKGGYYEQAWRLCFREQSGYRSVLVALALPSGILGLVFVIAETILTVVLHLA